MKNLLIMRHAKSSWDDSSISDHDRPLNNRGKRDAVKIGRVMKKEKLIPDTIASSTAVRAHATAKIASKEGGFVNISLNASFYLANASTYIEELKKINESSNCVLIVGHNPGIEELVEYLTGYQEPLPTCTLVYVTLPISSWDELDAGSKGKIVNIWRPKEIQ